MRLIIHDMDLSGGIPGLREGDTVIPAAWLKKAPCVGCFGCWIKTPGRCLLRDDIGDMAAHICEADGIAVISRCVYGGYSPEIKNVLDRSVGFLLPSFTIRGDGRMHHPVRSDRPKTLDVHFYGEVTARERETARRIVSANAVNFNIPENSVYFHADAGSALEAL